MDGIKRCLRCVILGSTLLVAEAHAQFIDHFADAVSLGNGLGFVTSLGATSATVEVGEAPGDVIGLASLWGNFTPAEEGFFLLRVEGASNLLTASVFTGETRESLTLITSGSNALSSEDSPVLRFHATPEETYRIRIAQHGLPFGNLTKIILEPLESAPNANRERALDLGNAASQTFGGNLLEATEPGHSLWWEWSAPTDGIYAIKRPSNIAYLSLTHLTELKDAPSSLFGQNTQPSLSDHNGQLIGGLLQMQADQRIRIGLIGDTEIHALGEVEATIERIEWETANNTTQEQAIDLGEVSSASVGPFVLGRTEPGPIFDRRSRSGQTGGWWRWTPTFSGNAEFRVIEWTGRLRHANIARFDGQRLVSIEKAFLRDGTSTATLTVTAGVQELLYISAKEAQTAVGITFRLGTLAPPSNDDFENATELAASDFYIFPIENNLLATPQEGEPLHGSKPTAARSQWWKWSPATAGAFDFEVDDHQVSVYQGTTLDNLTMLARGNQDVSFDAVPGEFYYLTSAVVIGKPFEDFYLRKRLDPLDQEASNTTRETAIDLGSEDLVFEGLTGEQSSGWWTWIAPRDGVARLRYQHQSSLSVYARAGNGAPLAQTLRGDTITFLVTSGARYDFKIGPLNQRFQAHLQVITTNMPVNDVRERAEPILEPRHYSVTWHNFGGEDTRWWSWTPEEPAIHELKVPSGFLPRVSYTNGLGLRFDVELAPTGDNIYQFPTRASFTHQLSIRPTKSSDARSLFGLTLKQLDLLPAADERAEAIDLGDTTSLNYRASLLEATSSDQHRLRDVWFRWTALGDGIVTFFTPYPGVQTTAALDKDDSPSSPSGTMRVQLGEVYVFRVAISEDLSWEQVDPTFELHLTFQEKQTAYDAWLADEGASLTLDNSAPSDDPDHDGVSNLLEFVHGTNPLEPNVDLQKGARIVRRTNGMFLEVQISPATGRGTELLPLWIESSNDLRNWNLYHPLSPGNAVLPLPNNQASWYRLRVGATEAP